MPGTGLCNSPVLIADRTNSATVVYSTRDCIAAQPEGMLLYMKTAEGDDSLALVKRQGRSVTQSQLAILRLAQCLPAPRTTARSAAP